MDGNTMARNLHTPFGKQRNGVSIWMIRSGKPISFTELQNSNPKVNYLVTFGIETASIFSKLFSIRVKRSLKEREREGEKIGTTRTKKGEHQEIHVTTYFEKRLIESRDASNGEQTGINQHPF